MTISLEITNSEELRIQLPRIRDAFRQSARSTETLKGPLRRVAREIDALIKESFTGKRWAPWSERTEQARFKETGYYGEVPPRADSIGRWSDDMFEGLLGRGLLGDTIVETDELIRTYTDHGPRASRVVWFHEGTKNQPARPFWRERERSEIAKRVIREHFSSRVTSRFL